MTNRGTATQASPAARLASEILRATREGPALAACTVIASPDGTGVQVGAKMLVYADARVLGSLDAGPLNDSVGAVALAAIPRHAAETYAFRPDGVRLEGRREVAAAKAAVEVLVEVMEPAPTLLVIGAGHVGRALAEIGALLGMSVAVLDDREDYADPERLPFAERVICGEVSTELDRFAVTPNTYVVLVSRGHTLDEEALRHVVERGAAYVGMIGSQRRTRTVLEHLRREGISSEALGRVFTPIGLDIGAETPAEISVAVLAEIIFQRRGGGALPMSEYGRTQLR